MVVGALGTAAIAAARTKDNTYLGAKYRRLAPRLGKTKAIVALEHSILTAVWHMLTDDVDYHDLGGDYFARLDPERAMRRIVSQAKPSATPYVSTQSRPPDLRLSTWPRRVLHEPTHQAISSHQVIFGPDESHCRNRALDSHGSLAHADRRRRLPRPWR